MEPSDDPAAEAAETVVLAQIAELGDRIRDVEEALAVLYCDRLDLFVAARRLDPPLTMTRIALSAGITQVTVTNTLKKATVST